MESSDLLNKAGPLLLLYRENLPQRLEMNAIVRALGKQGLRDEIALDIGMPSPAMSALLRQRGGKWSTVARSSEIARRGEEILGGTIPVLSDDGILPFEDRSFDWIVLARGTIETRRDPLALIKECHRILKDDGRLVLNSRNRKKASPLNKIRRGLPGEEAEGYTEQELFLLLNTGFDVLSVAGFCKPMVEMVRLLAERARKNGGDSARIRRRAKLAYAVVSQFDYFGRGHALSAFCRRRPWRPRKLPVLADGRSLQEAVLKHVGG